MTDLQRLHDWHESESSEFAKVLANGDKTKLAAIAHHAETARILALLLRARKECGPGPHYEDLTTRQRSLHIIGPGAVVNALAELLGGAE